MKILDRIKRELARLFARLAPAPESETKAEPAADIFDGEQSPSVRPATEPEKDAPSTEPAPPIRWTCGGFDGSRAVETPDAQVGGKFDWISTSRTTRDFANIKDGYHGWNWRAFVDAERRAFCIVSAGGKRRTNLAEDGK